MDKIIEHSLRILRCPICSGDLRLRHGMLKCVKCSHNYPIRDGIIDLLPKSLVFGNDRRWMKFYDRSALSYFILFHRVIPAFTLGAEGRARRKWVKLLQIGRGDVVLDVATGTGKNIQYLVEKVGAGGLVYGIDISMNMLRYAARVYGGLDNVILIRANASHLPFKDECFDAVIHVGGINTFEEKGLAIKEMFRVVKHNAKVVIVDEGLDPRLRRSILGRLLLKINALYASTPPLKELEEVTDSIHIEWGLIPSKIVPIWPYYLVIAKK